MPSLSASWNGKEVKPNGSISFPGWIDGHAPVWPSVPVSIGRRGSRLPQAYGVPEESRSKFLGYDGNRIEQYFRNGWIRSGSFPFSSPGLWHWGQGHTACGSAASSDREEAERSPAVLFPGNERRRDSKGNETGT